MGGNHHHHQDVTGYSSSFSSNNFTATGANAADDDGYNGDGLPLNDTTRVLIVIIHYLAVPFVTFALYGVMKNIHIIEQRIWSPFVLVMTLSWLLMATTFEISNHYYVNNWQLYDPKSDLINGTFSFFNFDAQNLMALSLRKKGIPFVRIGISCLDWTSLTVDPILVLLIVVNSIVYGLLGRSTSVKALSPLASIAGLFTLFRVWYNLRPNIYTKLGGILFFVLVLNGVAMNVVYNAIDDEWVHALIGGSFISSTIPLGIAFLNAEDKEKNESSSSPIDDDDEQKDLKVKEQDQEVVIHHEKGSSAEEGPVPLERTLETKPNENA